MRAIRRPEWVSYLLDLWDHHVRRLDRPEPCVCLGVWPSPPVGTVELTRRAELAEKREAEIREDRDQMWAEVQKLRATVLALAQPGDQEGTGT